MGMNYDFRDKLSAICECYKYVRCTWGINLNAEMFLAKMLKMYCYLPLPFRVVYFPLVETLRKVKCQIRQVQSPEGCQINHVPKMRTTYSVQRENELRSTSLR